MAEKAQERRCDSLDYARNVQNPSLQITTRDGQKNSTHEKQNNLKRSNAITQVC